MTAQSRKSYRAIESVQQLVRQTGPGRWATISKAAFGRQRTLFCAAARCLLGIDDGRRGPSECLGRQAVCESVQGHPLLGKGLNADSDKGKVGSPEVGARLERYGFESILQERLVDRVWRVSVKPVSIEADATNVRFRKESEHQTTTRLKHSSKLSHRIDEIGPKINRVDGAGAIKLLIAKGHRIDTAVANFESTCIDLAAKKQPRPGNHLLGHLQSCDKALWGVCAQTSEQSASAKPDLQNAACCLDCQVLQNQVIELGIENIQEAPHDEAAQEAPWTGELICQKLWWAKHRISPLARLARGARTPRHFMPYLAGTWTDQCLPRLIGDHRW